MTISPTSDLAQPGLRANRQCLVVRLDEPISVVSVRPRQNWRRVLYLLAFLVLFPPIFNPLVNQLTSFLNWTDQVFGWDWHAVAFAIIRWFSPDWNPGA